MIEKIANVHWQGPGKEGPGGRTVLQLRNAARQRGLKGRSAMNKAQLEAALA